MILPKMKITSFVLLAVLRATSSCVDVKGKISVSSQGGLKNRKCKWVQLFQKLSLAALMGMQAASGATFGAPLAFAAPAKLPSVEVMQGFPPDKFNVAEYCAGKNVIIVGLPGAFTPT
jgi:hypothetical protein